MTKLLDQSSRDRIVQDLQQSLLVEAGAGSGKTHEMARRMAAGVAAGDLNRPIVDGPPSETKRRE